MVVVREGGQQLIRATLRAKVDGDYIHHSEFCSKTLKTAE